MSRADVSVCEEMIVALNRRDVAATLERCHADVEWESPGSRIEGGEPYRGHDGIRRYFKDLEDAWGKFRITVDESRDLGSCVVLLGRTQVRGRAGGVDFDYPFGTVLEIHDGKLARGRVYLDHEEALAAGSAITGANA